MPGPALGRVHVHARREALEDVLDLVPRVRDEVPYTLVAEVRIDENNGFAVM